MDGLDAMRELKAEHNLPVIFLTARRRELDEIVGLEIGADDYITKPFSADVLLAHAGRCQLGERFRRWRPASCGDIMGAKDRSLPIKGREFESPTSAPRNRSTTVNGLIIRR